MERNFEPSGDGLPHGARNYDPARRCLALQPSGHIYGVTVDVIALHDNVAKVEPDPEYDCFVARLVAICLDHGLLEIYGGAERVHGAGELDKAPIALEPDHPTAAAHGGWGEPLVQM